MRFIITLLFVTSFLSAGEKIALLIGNNDYSFQPLANPLNDVDGIYKTLRAIGFEKNDIKVLKNASKTKMETALANFSQRASSAEIALVYFSGHGMQVNNTNYMFPAKANPTKPVDLFGLVDLNYFIQSASSAKYGIILVDACRTNPLVKYFQNGKHKGSTAKKGLGQVTPKTGQVVIGFATSAGDTADDGNGNMSPYARALSERLKEPNKDITKVLGLVALDVSAKYEQKPIYRANLAYDVILNKNDRNNDLVTIDGLIYQNQPFNRKYTWQEAKEYCESLTLNGYQNWRLPHIYELEKLLTTTKNINSQGYQYYIKKEFIKNLFKNPFFWSSSKEYSSGRLYSEGINFDVQFIRGKRVPTYATGRSKNYTLCVR